MKLNTAYYKEMFAYLFAYAIGLGVVALFDWIIGGHGLTEHCAMWMAIFCLLSNHCLEHSEKQPD